MNRVLLEAAELGADGLAVLDDRRAEHISSVLRAVPGQELRVGVLGVGRGTARVAEVGGGRVVLEVAGPLEPEAPADIDLIVALPRPQVLHRVLQTATIFGVGRLDLIRSWRVEKSYFGSPSVAPAELRRQLMLGAEQGGTSRLPEVAVHPRFHDFLATLPPPNDREVRLVAELGVPRRIEEVFAAPPATAGAADEGARYRLAVGPEGGFIDRELQTFAEHGFGAVELGPWNLRVEMALAAFLAQLDLLRRRSPAAAGVPRPARAT